MEVSLRSGYMATK